MLDDVKLALRISSSAFDSEVQDLIDAAKADLQLSGVDEIKLIDTDPLIKRAIVTYVKANFGFDNPDAERLQRAYD
ncbi:DNA-packaging protein, partial [Corallococcus carmarthensis]|nr:DNA-packaging protein [Corallococcus carmarthensis]